MESSRGFLMELWIFCPIC